MRRKRYFRLPPNSVIEEMTDASFQRERRGVLARTKQIYRLFGPPRDMLFSGVMTADTYFEMINAYIFGLYISTIFAAHALIEASLSFGFMFNSDEEPIAEEGLHKIVSASFERGYITKELRDRLDELRAMRIAYFHSHVGLNKRGAMKRYLEKKLYGVRLHRSDAMDALKIVHQFLDETSPGFFS